MLNDLAFMAYVIYPGIVLISSGEEESQQRRFTGVFSTFPGSGKSSRTLDDDMEGKWIGSASGR